MSLGWLGNHRKRDVERRQLPKLCRSILPPLSQVYTRDPLRESIKRIFYLGLWRMLLSQRCDRKRELFQNSNCTCSVLSLFSACSSFPSQPKVDSRERNFSIKQMPLFSSRCDIIFHCQGQTIISLGLLMSQKKQCLPFIHILHNAFLRVLIHDYLSLCNFFFSQQHKILWHLERKFNLVLHSFVYDVFIFLSGWCNFYSVFSLQLLKSLFCSLTHLQFCSLSVFSSSFFLRLISLKAF